MHPRVQSPLRRSKPRHRRPHHTHPRHAGGSICLYRKSQNPGPRIRQILRRLHAPSRYRQHHRGGPRRSSLARRPRAAPNCAQIPCSAMRGAGRHHQHAQDPRQGPGLCQVPQHSPLRRGPGRLCGLAAGLHHVPAPQGGVGRAVAQVQGV